MIVKKKDPYMWILRARPRAVGRVQESVIVLLGADQGRIDKIIRLNRKNNNFVRA